jgi:hypothetical protein
MNNDHSGWDANMGSLTSEQRQRVNQWLRREKEAWAEREEQWATHRHTLELCQSELKVSRKAG